MTPVLVRAVTRCTLSVVCLLCCSRSGSTSCICFRVRVPSRPWNKWTKFRDSHPQVTLRESEVDSLRLAHSRQEVSDPLPPDQTNQTLGTSPIRAGLASTAPFLDLPGCGPAPLLPCIHCPEPHPIAKRPPKAKVGRCQARIGSHLPPNTISPSARLSAAVLLLSPFQPPPECILSQLSQPLFTRQKRERNPKPGHFTLFSNFAHSFLLLSSIRDRRAPLFLALLSLSRL